MVQGLAFLSKKSWHTKNLANQEKVWMAEQRKEAEDQKTKELAKQILQEKEQEELDKISGKKSTRIDRGVDWMYQGTTGALAKEDAERKAEEYLLGKEYVPEGAAHGDFGEGDEGQGINNVLKAKEDMAQSDIPGAAYANEPTVKDRNEDFHLRVEDPMFLVSQKQREKEARHDKTKALYERVVGYTEHYDQRDSKKKAKKEKKRHKKHKKKSSRRDRDRKYSDEDDRTEESRKHRHRHSRSSSRSRSPDPRPSKRHKRSPSHDRLRSRRGRDSSEESRHHDRRHRSHRDEQHRRYHRRDRDDSYDSSDRRSRRRDRSRSLERHKVSHQSRGRQDYEDSDRRRNHDGRNNRHRYDDKHRGSEPRRSRHEDDHYRRPENDRRVEHKRDDNHAEPPKKEGYGLKGGSVTVDRNNLGPNRDLLQKKREEQEAERRRIREAASSRRTRTDADRARALEEMQTNARKRDEHRSRDQGPRKYDDGSEAPRGRDASFLKEMTQRAHGIGEGGQSMSSRVAQNRHTNQRGHESFF
mmetsp:Transcript_86173/g.248845  ORF Transcript_86173/g.248845 Transcript_86173/m.248845 type:complete len:527 (-) Transcript_86173:94-1674(-)